MELLILGGLISGLLFVAGASAVLVVVRPLSPVAQATAIGVLVVGVALIPLAIAVNSSAGLRATKSTRAELVIDVGATWLVQLPIAWFLGFQVGLGVLGLFLAILAYWIIRAGASFVVFGKILAGVERELSSATNNNEKGSQP